jgi:hypothetical protein
MREEQVLPRAKRRRQCRLQTRDRSCDVLECDRGIDPAVESLGAIENFARNLFVDSEIPSTVIQNQLYERRKRQLTCLIARAVPTHTVSDHHRVSKFIEPPSDKRFRQAGQERLLMPANLEDEVVVFVDAA